MNQEINESVAVIVLFDKGKVQPLRIKWHNRVYRVKKIFNTWRQKVGYGYEIHIAVEVDSSDSMELVIDASDLSWRIARVTVAG